MTRKPKTAATSPAIDPAALYLVTLSTRAYLPHGEVLAVREEPYEMRGRLLASIIDQVAGFDLAPVEDLAPE